LRIRRIDIENFRGIKSASWRLPADRRFFALLGPGDSTKTTVLSAIERTLHDRAGLSILDIDFHDSKIDDPIRIRVAIDDLPDELIAMDAFGGFLAGIDEDSELSHDPADDSQRCVVVEFLVEADLEPVWQSYRPPVDGEEEDVPTPIRARHRALMTAYRIDDRVDAHLRWSRSSSLGKLTANREDTRATLTKASRAASVAAAEAVTDDLKALAKDVQRQVQSIGTIEFADLKPGLDLSLASAQGNLALFDGDIPLTNFGLGTRRLTGAATQQLANEGTSILLVDEVEYGLEPHRLVHLLGHLRKEGAFSQVFVTTHSPTALLHLEPDELVMVRSRGGNTELRPLDDPSSLRPLLKSCPEAFLARRIVINEGKTEYGVVLELLHDWDRGASPAEVPSAALGVVAVEGGGGVKSAGRAKQFLEVGYDVVLFIDSDDKAANEMVPEVVALGGTVIQWSDDHCTETAVCAQLDEAGLNGFILAGIEAADNETSARQSFAVHLVANGAPNAATGADPLDVSTWLAASVNLVKAREVVGQTAKTKGWFKRVDPGRRLGRFILETPGLRTGDVGTTIEQLETAIYTGSETAATEKAAGPAEPTSGLSNA
jgi:putative ATP-dependent endonuclease of OLD family